jgi:phage protein D
MKTHAPIVTDIIIKVGGRELPRPIYTQLIDVMVDQHVHLPGMFQLRLRDPDLKLLDGGPFDLTKTVEIAATDADNHRCDLISGEITALEPEFSAGMVAELTVTGYDRLHRLYRENKSATYLNVKDSDLAQQIAGNAGLQADVEPTQTVYDHIFQDNLSDLAFLLQRARRIGYECHVRAGKLTFRKPVKSPPALTLTWGADMQAFHVRMALTEQVNEVTVRGWNVQNKAVIVGRATDGQLYPQIGEAKDGAGWVSQGGGRSRRVLVDQPLVSQAEADILAAARLDEISGAFIEADGVAFRRPDLKAGFVVRLEKLGKRLSGDYLVTRVTHRYTAQGLLETFQVSGARTGLLTEVLGGLERERWPGVVPAIVTNNNDPRNWGRVKVKYPWMSDAEESDWVRLAGPGAGANAGFCATPAVDDEVLVSFVHGDFGQPVVIGGLWNGKDALPPQAADARHGEKALVRTWHSRSGHRLTMFDNADDRIELVTKNGHTLVMSDADARVTLRSKGGLEMTFDDNDKAILIKSGGKVMVKAEGEMTVQAGGNLQFKAGGNLQMEATGSMALKANGRTSLESSAQVAVQAPSISLG